MPLIKILNKYESDPDTFFSQREEHDFKLIIIIIIIIISASNLNARQVKDSFEYPCQQAMILGRIGFGTEELVFELIKQTKRCRDL